MPRQHVRTQERMHARTHASAVDIMTPWGLTQAAPMTFISRMLMGQCRAYCIGRVFELMNIHEILVLSVKSRMLKVSYIILILPLSHL